MSTPAEDTKDAAAKQQAAVAPDWAGLIGWFVMAVLVLPLLVWAAGSTRPALTSPSAPVQLRPIGGEGGVELTVPRGWQIDPHRNAQIVDLVRGTERIRVSVVQGDKDFSTVTARRVRALAADRTFIELTGPRTQTAQGVQRQACTLRMSQSAAGGCALAQYAKSGNYSLVALTSRSSSGAVFNQIIADMRAIA